MSSPSARMSSQSSRTSTGRPSWIPCRRTGRASRSSARMGLTTTASCPSGEGENGSTAVEALLADEGDEPAGNGTDHRGAFGAADDELQPLGTPPTDRDDEAAARLELLVQQLRKLGRGRGDCDCVERRPLRDAAGAVAHVDAHALVSRGGEVL